MIPFLGEAFKDLTSSSNVRTDNFIFRLNYVVLSVMLFGASGILVTSQLFGVTIDCIPDSPETKSDSLKATIDNFCWVGGIYTIPELYAHKYNTRTTKQGTIYEGIGQFNPKAGHTKIEHTYYRWIFFLLFMEGLLLYLPHYLWKFWENGRMKALAEPFDSPYDSLPEAIVECLATMKPPAELFYSPYNSVQEAAVEWLASRSDKEECQNGVSKRINQITDSFAAYDINKYCRYTLRLYTCEALNLCMLIASFLLTDFALEKRFSGAGFEIMSSGLKETTVIDKLFPIHAKCAYQIFGSSGGRQELEALCVLPLNSFTSLFFKCLWFLLVIMMSLTVLLLVFRILTVASKRLRSLVMRLKVASYRIEHVDTQHPDPSQCINDICNIIPHGDWYVLYKLAENVDSVEYLKILQELHAKLVAKKEQAKRIRRPTVPDVTCVPVKPKC